MDTCSMPENTIVNQATLPYSYTDAHIYNTGSIAEQCHFKNSTLLGEHNETNPAIFLQYFGKTLVLLQHYKTKTNV